MDSAGGRARLRPGGREDEARRLLERLSGVDEYPEHASTAGQDAWMGLAEVESMLAGLLATYAAGGRVDKPALDEVAAASQRLEVRSEDVDAAVAFLAGTFKVTPIGSAQPPSRSKTTQVGVVRRASR